MVRYDTGAITILRVVEALYNTQSTTAPRRCKLPAYYDSASPVFLTSHIPAAIYRGSCGNVCSTNVYTFSQVPGGVAQLGERLNGIQEVRGSIPLASIWAAARAAQSYQPTAISQQPLIATS